MMAVAVNSGGGSMELGTARPLFGSIPPSLGHVYDVSKDGQRFHFLGLIFLTAHSR
jgi:hypothetical protein